MPGSLLKMSSHEKKRNTVETELTTSLQKALVDVRNVNYTITPGLFPNF